MIGKRAWAVIGLSVALILLFWIGYPKLESEMELQTGNELLLTGLSLALVVLAIGLVFVLVRNLVRLIVERKRGILGSRLRTKLVFFFLVLILLPSTVLFIGSARFIKETVEANLRTPMERLAEQSSEVVRTWNDYFREQNLARARAIAAELASARAGNGAPQELNLRLTRWTQEHDLEAVWVVRAGEQLAAVGSNGYRDLASRRQSIDALLVQTAERTAMEGVEQSRIDYVGDGLVVHAAVPIRDDSGDVVAVATLLPTLLAGDLDGFSEATRQFRQFRRHRDDLVRLYLTSIALIFLATLLCASWVGFYLARRITGPLQELASATHEIAAGNMDVRVDSQAVDEVGVLVDSFNHMAAELQENREVITRSTADLRRTNRALDERRRTIETLVANLSTGVLALDRAGRVNTVNPAMERILGIKFLPGDEALRMLTDAGYKPLADRLIAAVVEEGQIRRDLELERDDGTMQVSVQISPLVSGAGQTLGTLVMVEDLSALLQAQRAAAWREVARRIAHEIKNPLTPIQLSAQRLRRKFEENPAELGRVLPEATAAIEREVGALKQLVDEFSRFARMPEIRRQSVEFREVIESVLELYRGSGGVEWVLDLDPGVGRVVIDPQQMRRVLINLIDNSLAAMDGKGKIRIAAKPLGGQSIRISLADDGPGIPTGAKDKLFAPYFSTKKRGTGLGLAIVHKVVTEHQGTIRVEDNEPSGTRFIIEIPA